MACNEKKDYEWHFTIFRIWSGILLAARFTVAIKSCSAHRSLLSSTMVLHIAMLYADQD